MRGRSCAGCFRRNIFAGCYYIASGFGDDDGAQVNRQELSRTSLQFLAPQSAENSEVGNWSSEALGRSGTLAMWPGSLNHSVAEHTGDHERISLAFNLALTLKQ